MGRPRKPTARKILEGDRPDLINRAEPRATGRPDRPGYLDSLGVEAWERITPLLVSMGVLTASDAEALGLYCRAYSRWVQAEAMVAREGLTIKTETTTKAHPAIAISNECHRQMVRIISQFGLTPAARSGLSVVGKIEDDPLIAFLAREATDGRTQDQD